MNNLSRLLKSLRIHPLHQRLVGALLGSFITATFSLTWTSACAQELGPAPRLPELPASPPSPPRKLSVSVAVTNRQAVVDFYHSVYKASQGVPHEWTGNVATCTSGTTSQAYTDATILRINYFRAMAGLSGDVTADPTWSGKAQAAALMMSAQGQLSHFPEPTWACYTPQGAEAAGKANLTLGVDGPAAIDLYMDDPGPNNTPVGHRRWILYPPEKIVGVGNIPGGSAARAANALWVIGGIGPRPAVPEWVAWPPPNYVPYQILPKSSGRWSFSAQNAGFTNTSVVMSAYGTNIPVTLEPLWQGYGDTAIVWRPSGIDYAAPASDTFYSVTLSNVFWNGKNRTYTYEVAVIDPDMPALSLERIDNSAYLVSWPVTGGSYRLLASETLPPTHTWASWPTSPILQNGRYMISVAPTNHVRFFRLAPY